MNEVYESVKSRHQQELDELSRTLEFRDQGTTDAMKQYNIPPSDYKTVYGFGGIGSFRRLYRPEDSQRLIEVYERHAKELSEVEG